MLSRGAQEAQRYDGMAHSLSAPQQGAERLDVVLCHTQSTGDVVLLHNDWLQGGKIVF